MNLGRPTARQDRLILQDKKLRARRWFAKTGGKRARRPCQTCRLWHNREKRYPLSVCFKPAARLRLHGDRPGDYARHSNCHEQSVAPHTAPHGILPGRNVPPEDTICQILRKSYAEACGARLSFVVHNRTKDNHHIRCRILRSRSDGWGRCDHGELQRSEKLLRHDC